MELYKSWKVDDFNEKSYPKEKLAYLIKENFTVFYNFL